MERLAWTDERLDELARRMDAGFERLDERGLSETGAAVTGRVGGGIVVGLVGVIAAVFANGG